MHTAHGNAALTGDGVAYNLMNLVSISCLKRSQFDRNNRFHRIDDYRFFIVNSGLNESSTGFTRIKLHFA